MSGFFHRFLGTARWLKLGEAIRKQTEIEAQPTVGWLAAIGALGVAACPIFVTLADSVRTPGTASSDLPTMAFGICTLLALLLRKRMGFKFVPTRDWRESFSLTHTAIAAGCVPAVLVILLAPSLLADRHDVLTAATATSPGESGHPGLIIWGRIALVVAIALWVAVTEELIFRGLLVSTIRRFRYIRSQRARDVTAGILSAMLFGLAHWPTWGPLPSLALVGLGLGFVVAYIAIGEQLIPIVVYHFIFDLLSISISLSSSFS